jgi:cell division protein FtsB
MAEIQGLTLVVLILGFGLLIMWALRDLVVWYYKINKRIELLDKQYKELALINKRLERLVELREQEHPEPRQ